MAAEAQVRSALVGQHMPVVRAVDLVAGRAAFDAGGLMFVEERTAFVGVAAEALFLFEPGQPRPRGGLMGVVTGRAGHHAFLETMPLVGLELGEDILVTDGAGHIDAGSEKSGRGVAMDAVAGRAVQGRLGMGAGAILRVILVVAGQALGRLLLGSHGWAEGEDAALALALHVFLGAAVAGRAALVPDLGVGLERKGLDGVLMACAAGLRVLLLSGGSGRREKSDGREDKGEDSEPVQRVPGQRSSGFR